MSDAPPEPVEEVEEGAPPWMATFADLMSLLLTFFVLLLSFANMDVQNFRMALGSVREAMGVQFEHPGDRMGLTTSIVEMSKQESTDTLITVEAKVSQVFKSLVEKRGVDEQVEVSLGERGIVVRIKDLVLFEPGGTQLRPQARKPLMVVGDAARELDLPLWIEGHTDNRPIRTVRFPSNWELSAGRAVSTLRFLRTEAKVPKYRMHIAGYADTRPLRSNTTAEGRADNRRVEFVFIQPLDKDEDARRVLLFRANRLAQRYDLRMPKAPQSDGAPGGAAVPGAASPSQRPGLRGIHRSWDGPAGGPTNIDIRPRLGPDRGDDRPPAPPPMAPSRRGPAL